MGSSADPKDPAPLGNERTRGRTTERYPSVTVTVPQVRSMGKERSTRGFERGETIPIQVGGGASLFGGSADAKDGCASRTGVPFPAVIDPFIPVNAGHSPRRYSPGRD